MRDTHREREREREAETQAEGEAGSMQGAQHGTRSWVSRITPWAEGRAKPLSHLGCPYFKASPRHTSFLSLSLFKNLIYLLMRDTERERGRDPGRGRSRLHAGSPTWDSIPGLQNHTPG